MIGLFDEIYKEKYKYINALDALYFLVSTDNYPVSKIAKFLLTHNYHKSTKTYKENHLEQMELVDSNQEDSSIESYYQITKDILNKALDNFIYNDDDRIQPYKKTDYQDYFWLKEDLFNFEGFKKLGVKVENDDYEKYLNYKRIDELDEVSRVQKAFKDWEGNLNSYWNLRVLPKIFEIPDDRATLLDILRIAVKNYTISYQFLESFFHNFIYCPNDNLLDKTQNNILLKLIEDLANTTSGRLYRPINLDDILMNSSSLALVHWDVDDLAAFFVKQDNKMYEYENIWPRFYRRESDNETLLHENKKLKLELNQAKERIKQLEEKEVQSPANKNAINDAEINLINSDLLLIAALLNMLQNEIEAKGNKSQAKILQRIEDEHEGIKGLSKSRTEKIMGSANGLYKPLINKRMK
ncbi:hypothetical protein EC844_12430 [Acinetobacter calcoaceticus]|uniref:Uncharacterized protein n=1 Tax=Acinetobacter calcoaceticus TaxID=471 RepID=A0A4R1XIN2_ACICA|nr:hypothetical protein EC844_12430 [Acinetobacter calcoaceticus]